MSGGRPAGSARRSSRGSTVPLSLSCATTALHGRRRDREGDADRAAGRREIAVLTPMTLPSTSKVGPPELPLFTGASIWMKSS